MIIIQLRHWGHIYHNAYDTVKLIRINRKIFLTEIDYIILSVAQAEYLKNPIREAFIETNHHKVTRLFKDVPRVVNC